MTSSWRTDSFIAEHRRCGELDTGTT